VTGAVNGQQEPGARVKRSLAPIVALVGVVTAVSRIIGPGLGVDRGSFGCRRSLVAR